MKESSNKMSTMSDRVNSLTKEGYTESFQTVNGGIKALSDNTFYSASDIEITNFYRFEGNSDPSDNAIVYVIKCNDGKKGLIIDSYGMSADPAIGEFIVEVESIHKKMHS